MDDQQQKLERMQAELESLWWRVTREQLPPGRMSGWIKERRYLRDQTIRNLEPHLGHFGKRLCRKYLNLHRQIVRLKMTSWKKEGKRARSRVAGIATNAKKANQ